MTSTEEKWIFRLQNVHKYSKTIYISIIGTSQHKDQPLMFVKGFFTSYNEIELKLFAFQIFDIDTEFE